MVGNLEVFSSLFALPLVTFRLWVVECVNVHIVRKCVVVHTYVWCVCACSLVIAICLCVGAHIVANMCVWA